MYTSGLRPRPSRRASRWPRCESFHTAAGASQETHHGRPGGRPQPAGLRRRRAVGARRRDRAAPCSGWRLVIFVVLMVQQTVMVALRIGGAHPDLLWLLPITAALLDGPETGAIVGFWAGLAFDLVLPTPFGLSALVGCLLGLRRGVPDDGGRPPGGLAQAGGRGRGERRSGHAVRRARRDPRTAADGADRLPGPLPGGRRLERRAGAPGQPADAVGPGRGEQPPLARLRPRPTAGSGEAHPPPPDPRRPAAPQAVARARAPRARGGATRRQPRMRPRKSVNVASIVGSPEEEESRPEPAPAHRRASSCCSSSASSSCACGRSRWSRGRPTPPP